MVYKIVQIEEEVLSLNSADFGKIFGVMGKQQNKEFASSVSKELMNTLKVAKAQREKQEEEKQMKEDKIEEYKKMFEDY